MSGASEDKLLLRILLLSEEVEEARPQNLDGYYSLWRPLLSWTCHSPFRQELWNKIMKTIGIIHGAPRYYSPSAAEETEAQR